MYATITDDGFEFHKKRVKGSLPVVDTKPEAEEGFVASLSRYKKVGEEVHTVYNIENLPRTSESHIDRLAEAIAKRLR